MKIKAAIFDVDGVLLDTVPYHFKAWKKLFEEQGIKFTFNDYLLKVNGLPRITGIKNIIKSKNLNLLEHLANQKQKYFTEFVLNKPPQPLEGALELINELFKKNIKLAAASSSKNAPLLLESSGLSSYLSVIVGGMDFKKPKPDPEIFLTASNELDVPPFNSVVFEDAFLGIIAAKKANMKTIGLLTSNDKNIKKEADITIKSLKQKLEILSFVFS